MGINKHNYGIFIVDFYDGNLSESQVSELMLFLENNPEIKKEFEGFNEIISVPDTSLDENFKNSLKKQNFEISLSPGENNINEFIISYLEGDLTSDQELNLKYFLDKNPKYKKELQLFRQIKLQPDYNQVFENREQLKKPGIIPFRTITENNYEHYFISKIEGELRYHEIQMVEEFLSLNPHLADNLKKFTLAVLSPDFSIKYYDKNKIKKEVLLPFSRRKIYSTLCIAATLLILVGAFLTYHPYMNPPRNNDSPISKNSNHTLYKKNDKFKAPVLIAQQPKSIKISNQKNNLIGNNNLTEMEIVQSKKYELVAQRGQQTTGIYDEVRTYYTEILVDYQFRNSQMLESNPDLALDTKKEPITLAEYSLSKLQEFSNQPSQSEPSKKVSWWDLAFVSVAGFNKLTNSNVTLDRQTDNSGQTSGYALTSNAVNFNRSKGNR